MPYLKRSKIQALRQHCIGLVSASQLRDAMNYINNEIPSIVASVLSWVESGSPQATAENRAQLRRSFMDVERRLRRVC
jgi:hypothetical protein